MSGMKKDMNFDSDKILMAAAQSFHSYMVIDLIDDNFKIYNTNYDVQKYTSEYRDAKTAMLLSATNNVIPLQRDEISEFTDLSTLGQRLKENPKHKLSREFLAIHSGWVRISFIPVDENENGNITKVIFTVQQISYDKDWRERYERIANTDEITGIPNINAYSKIMVHFAQTGIPENLTLINLIITSDLFSQDTTISEECITKLRDFSVTLQNLIGQYSCKIFRIEVNEFIILFEGSSVEKDLLGSALDTLNEQNDINLHFVYGMASQEILHLNSIDFLIKYAKYESHHKLSDI